jgi:2,3-bisphosphoglycerate-independent phosphoglycerate mutase
VLEYLENCGDDFRILIMPDHPTPLVTMTHSPEPVPFMIYDSRKAENGAETFTEKTASESGIFVEHGPSIMDKLLGKM